MEHLTVTERLLILLPLLISLAFNVVQMRWWQADRAELARLHGQREAEARATRLDTPDGHPR